MPGPACDARATAVREYATRAGCVPESVLVGSRIASRMVWDAPAAAEYPRAMLSDAADAAALWPDLAAAVWHHAAGATILGTYCCGTPGSHRDALADIAREIRRRAGDAS